MTIEQTIEVPVDRKILINLPLELPVGKAKMELTITPESVPLGKTVKPLKSLFGIHKNLDTMNAYFERKRANKLFEDNQYARNRKV